ncbi:MAG: histidine kinase [Bacteroidia bacterium]|nr:histidine kinase [Bacteroidia bacterium]
MFKTLYNKYPYFFNLLIVLVLLEITRTLDWMAWYPPSPRNTRILLLEQLFEFLSLFPFVLLMIVSYKWAIKKRRVPVLVVLVLVFAIFGPTLLLYFSSGLETVFWHRANRPPVTMDVLKKYSPGLMAAILFLSTTFYLTRLQLRFAKQKDEMHKAETLAKEVQLKMLHYQINPHFLFNVLNSIHALIDENTGKAKKLVVDMSDYYRYTLNKQEQAIPIGKEVEAVIKYLEIQKTRFEENFDYEISVAEATREILIPSFVIHLLIENAVKYGIKSREQKLVIRLTTELNNRLLLIKVLNTGKLNTDKSGTDGTGSGIENIKNRLALFCNDKYSFSLTADNGWVTAAIEIEFDQS